MDRRLLTLAFLVASTPAFAQEINEISVEPKNPTQNQAVQLVIKSTGGSAGCGLEVSFGDGTVRKIRGDTFPIKVEHIYQKDGSYTISVTGQLIIRGLRSLTACAGSKSIDLQVGGNEVAAAAPASPVPSAAIQSSQMSVEPRNQQNQREALGTQLPTSTDGSGANTPITIDLANFKNKSGVYHSLFLANQTPRICAISSEVVNEMGRKKNPQAELMHNVAVISFATNIEKYAPDGYKIPKLIKPSVRHPFVEKRGSVKWWLPDRRAKPDFNDHFEKNHTPWANDLLEDGFHRYVEMDFIDKIGKGVIKAGDYRPLPGDSYGGDIKGCSILLGFPEHIKQAAEGLARYGHKFHIGEIAKLDQLLEDYADNYWNVKWDTYQYVRYNIAISPSTMLMLRELGFDSASELAKLTQAIKAGQLEKEYFSGLNKREEKHAIDLYLHDLQRSKKLGTGLIAVRDSRQKLDNEYVAAEAKESEKRRADFEATASAEKTEREKRRERLRSNMKISTGVSCIADERTGATEINYIAGMYANNTNIQIITSYVTNSRICYLTRQSYAAKNFKELSGKGQLVTLQSKTKNADGNFIFTMVNGRDWYVD